MSRYFDIRITDRNGKQLERWSSHEQNGTQKDGFLSVQFNFPVTTLARAAGNGTLRVDGVPAAKLGQKYNMNGNRIKVFAGMGKGLPLANPKQRGLILDGYIQNTYPINEGIQKSINFIIVGSSANLRTAPLNLTLIWEAKQKLADALNNVFKDYKCTIDISDDLKLNYTLEHHFDTLDDFADWLKDFTANMPIKDNYAGVSMLIDNNKLTFKDGTKEPKGVIEIDPTDIIGQPVWQTIQNVDLKTVMRGDLDVMGKVKLPKRLISQFTPQTSVLNEREKLSFNGEFWVTQMFHIGDSRGTTGDAWVTILSLAKTL